jgi:L-alanine-DL-glutamate epimerase-like enolase superfamily enzyme
MKIREIETLVFEDPFLPQVFVSVRTDEGLTGIGEAWWGLSTRPVVCAVDDVLAPLLIGEDPSRIEALWHKMYQYAYRYGTEGVILCALSGIDLALWDLLGKTCDLPVRDLIGGRVRNKLKAYASLPPLGEEAMLRQEVERALAAGYKGVKLHEVEPDLVAAVRAAAPAEFPIMLDVNGQWTPEEFKDGAKKLEKLNLVWLEEPVWPMQDHRAMARLRNRTRIPFAAGENEFTLAGFDRLMRSEAVDYIQPEITKVGGISAVKKISALAELYNFPLCPHGFRVGPAFYANVHWALSQVGMEWLEIPFLPEGWEFPGGIELPEMKDGEVYLPGGPGLGVPGGHHFE